MQSENISDNGIVDLGNLYRIGRTIRKAMAGDGITVGMIGGSITQGSRSSSPKTCYAYLVYMWWVNRFPNCKIQYINAGIGGTTSQFGTARVEEDLLAFQPDFIITEFSVNDQNTPFFRETYEGLIRQCLTCASEPGILILNNVCYNDGTNTQEMHNEVGAYYKLPMVSIKDSLYQLVKSGAIDKAAITPDDLHPNDAGHKLVAEKVTHLLDIIYEKVEKEEIEKEYIFPEKTLTDNRFEDSLRLNNNNAKPLARGFQADKTPKAGITDVFRDGFFARKVGDTISFEVEAGNIAVQYKKTIQRKAPVATAVIDGDSENPVILDANFEEDWGDCLYLQNLLVGGSKGRHRIDITITEADEESNLDFYLVSMIISDRV